MVGRAFECIQLTFVHRKGVDKVWADLFGRWSVAVVIRGFVQISVLPQLFVSNFEGPSLLEIESQQSQHASSRPPSLQLVDSSWGDPIICS